MKSILKKHLSRGYSFRQPNQFFFQTNHTGKIHTSSQTACGTQLTISLKTYWNTISEIENHKDQSTEFQKTGTASNNWRIIWAIPI